MDTENMFLRAFREVPEELCSIGTPSFKMYCANAQVLEETIEMHQKVAKYISENPQKPEFNEDPVFGFSDVPQEMLEFFAERRTVTMDIVAILMRFAIEHPEIALMWLASMGSEDPEPEMKDYFQEWIMESVGYTLFRK